ncbi:MAG: sigma-54-dependent Fis family transcriptional regulator [Myxococcales bacterium]|nr:sigma-54-dependent Fis family transcriptional regulator [Myxococcales bacterium]
MTRARVLVVDDKENMLKLFAKLLGDAYELVTAGDGARALALVQAQPFDVIVTDLRMPGADGFEVLRAVKQRQPDAEVIMMTGYATVNDAVEAIKLGAYDYLEKPFDPDAAALAVARALERKRLKEQAANLQKELQHLHAFHNIIGKSRAMQAVYRLLEQAAGLDITVLITGDTGTGKELAARAIHYQSARKAGRFVPVNCGALPSELVESELFGHARGAFSGAATAKPGLFEEAVGGTIFLDEIGELPLAVQVKLNRALQEHEIRRVGDTASTKVDVRVIAATHRDLKAEVAAGRFREDLYYRLHVFPIRLPALHERRDDIPLLAAHFVAKHAQTFGRAVSALTPDALRCLVGYGWPGNVRELEHVIERAVAISAGPAIAALDLPDEVRARQVDDLPLDPLVQLPYREALEAVRERFSRDYLLALLREFDGNVTRAAERAGVERESLHRLLKRYGVRSDDVKPRA